MTDLTGTLTVAGIQYDVTGSKHVVPAPTPAPVKWGVALKDWTYTTSLGDFQTLVAKKPKILTLGYGFGSNWYAADYASAYSNGSTVLVTWMPNSTTDTLANITAGKSDAAIITMATNLNGVGHEVWLRFAHEMNGSWYSWGKQPATYISAWKHIHDVFKSHAPNVKFVWCPNVQWDAASSFTQYFPGDAYIDYLGIDGYNKVSAGQWMTFEQLFNLDNTYMALRACSTKPIVICEIGCAEASEFASKGISVPAGATKATWITDAYGPGLVSMPQIGGIVWYNINESLSGGDGTGNFLVNSSPGSLSAFKNAVGASKFA